MLIGLGDLGGHVLEMLVRVPGWRRIITADVNEEWGYRKTNLAAFGAAQLGYYPELGFMGQSRPCPGIDLFNVEQTAETILACRPDIIYSAATLQSWWVIDMLPEEVFEELDQARIGPWIPMHLTLVFRLMQAVKETGLDVKVINSSVPDVVNPVLGKVGLAPTIGIGNVANVVPPLRTSIAYQLGAAVEDVKVFCVAHHFVSHHIARYGHAGGAPYYLKAMVDGHDVTADLDVDEVLAELPRRFRRPGGRAGHSLTASSALAVILAMANDTGCTTPGDFTHAPGPNGLPGGYPVTVDGQGGRVTLPPDIDLEEAIRINEEGAWFDGIERIDADGTIHFREEQMRIMKDMLGYSVQSMTVEESEACYRELDAKYRAFASQFE
jgi:hypothetical protein